jgi:hypothetical protein
MLLGVLLGMLSIFMVTLPLLKLVRNAPSVTTPDTVTLHLASKGLYKVYQLTGTADGPAVPAAVPGGATSIRATDLSLRRAGDGEVAVTEVRHDEIITRNRRIYTAAVAFRVAAPGDYTLQIAGAHGEVLVARSLADAVRSRVGWVAGIPIGGLLFLTGLVLLIIGFVRRSGPKGAALQRSPG